MPDDLSALKGTLFAQQQLLHELGNELDAEREASATAATEALSVILRLQEEKAAVRMEAEQYRRVSEERICHAEESLAIIEGIIYQREMEVAALEFQVEAHRRRLLNIGGRNTNTNVISKPEMVLICKAVVDDWTDEDHAGNPPPPVLDSDKINENFAPVGHRSYRPNHDIRELNCRMEETGVDHKCSHSTSCDLPNLRPFLQYDETVVDEVDHPNNNRVVVDNPCCMRNSIFHDAFEEVPRTHSRSGRDDVFHPDAIKPSWWFTHSSMESTCMLSDTAPFAVAHLGASACELANHFGRGSESSSTTTTTATMMNRSAEECKLLNDIKEKLDSLHDEIKRWKGKKSSAAAVEEPYACLTSLIEAMLHFWL